MDKQSKKGKRRLGVRELVVLIAAVPLLLACIIITLFAGLTLSTGLSNKALEELRSVAVTAGVALNELDSGTLQYDGENLYKGKYNITENIDFLDMIAAQTGAEITIFVGDTRRATTIKNNTGQRSVGTTADPNIVSAVLIGGNEYSATDTIINGKRYYTFYAPYIDSQTRQVVGMIFAGKQSETVTRYINTRMMFIIIVAVAIFAFCLVSSTLIVKSKMLKPIKKLSSVANQVAEGDVNIEIKRESDDEFGDLMEDFAAMVKNISQQARVTEQVAGGDLTVSYTPVSENDVMGKAIKKMIHDNNKNLSTIRDAAARMASGASEVASASNSLAQGTTEQASAIQEITASIEEIANGAKINADDANAANELVQSTKEGAIRGNEQMKNMIEAMRDINESSENISKIMKVIDDIAFQTNILALNASVEAARAGVHGKGFSVVADEVRNLASKSAEAAKDSAEMIEDSIKKVDIGSKLAVETASALEEILQSVENIATLVSHIATASVNQASSVGQVNSGINQIADVVQTNSATSEQCAAASAELSSLAGQLQHAVGKYRLIAGKSHAPAVEYDEEFDNSSQDSYQDNESIISLGDDFGKY